MNTVLEGINFQIIKGVIHFKKLIKKKKESNSDFKANLFSFNLCLNRAFSFPTLHRHN